MGFRSRFHQIIHTMTQPTPFFKTQREIPLNELVSRQHAIPADVYKFARMAQFDFVGKPGRGRSNVPTLCDIYETLAIEGMAIVRRMLPTEPQRPFIEIGQPDDCTMARIKFDAKFDTELRLLKSEADAGQFIVTPSASDARQVSKISLISLAVNLMRFAISARENAAQSTITENGTNVPDFVSRETVAATRRAKRANSAK